MNTIKYCDFNIICRICLTKGGINFTTDAVISNIFHKLTDLDFQTDDLPQQICLKCFEQINEIHRFSFKCKRSHSALIECLNQQKNPEPKNEIVDVKSKDISDKIQINENEVEEEITTDSGIFINLDILKTEEELKEEILDLQPDVISNEVEDATKHNEIIDSENIMSVNNDDRPYKCGKCSKAFIEKSHLIQHKCIHKSKYPYKCTQCSCVFKSQSRLVLHKRLNKEFPFICGYCSKTFCLLSAMVKHKRTHTNERPYKCEQCPKRFKHASNLIAHKQVHGDERSFKCDQCPKDFKHRSGLYIHRQRHSNKGPYKCDQCEKKFSLKYSLNRHIKIDHKQLE